MPGACYPCGPARTDSGWAMLGKGEAMVSRVRITALLVCVAVGLAGCGRAEPCRRRPGAWPPAAVPAARPAAVPWGWDQLVEDAKKEGEVIVWGNPWGQARRAEKDAFEKAYPGVKVTLFQATSASERDSRFLQEFQAGVAKVDVMVSGAPTPASSRARCKMCGRSSSCPRWWTRTTGATASSPGWTRTSSSTCCRATSRSRPTWPPTSP